MFTNHKKITVRSASSEDCEAIFLMSKSMATSFEVEQDAFTKSFSEVVNNSDSICLIAETKGSAIGYLLGFDHPAFYANGRVSWMEEIYVSDDFRRNGIGRLLTTEFEKWCSGRKSKLIGLATRRASDFYTSMDYEESATFFRKLL